jgi:uncharacterized membrane protein YidH (DUF202 family)
MSTVGSLSPDEPLEALKEGVEQARREARPWIEALGRFGYAAKGVVYLIIGVLAVEAALGRGGATTDQRGAMARVAQAPFGQVLLVVLAVGLLSYAVWRFVQAAEDTENKGSSLPGLLTRALYAGIGLLYVGLAVSALRLLLGAGVGSGAQQAQDWTALLLSKPMGQWLVTLVGGAVLANGLSHFYRAYRATFSRKLRLNEMQPAQVEWVTKVGRAGYAARGVAFSLIGIFLADAAMHLEPQRVRGLDGALAALAEQPFGPYLMALVAAGLAAYGVFALVEARYRRMQLY